MTKLIESEFDLLIRNGSILTASDAGFIEQGAIGVKDGKILAIGKSSEIGSSSARRTIDATGRVVLPGLIDCHTHLLEFASEMIHKVYGKSRRMAGTALLLEALESGITTVGEHNLGHPLSYEHIGDYKTIIENSAVNARIATGICAIGTDPLTIVSAITPGRTLTLDEITETVVGQVAKESEFPGENIFLTATVANLPVEKAPLAGKVVFDEDRLKKIVDIFHKEGKRIGAHVEGSEMMRKFSELGGDVIHHGHGLDQRTAETLSQNKVNVVMTPAAGTKRAPNSPEEIWTAYNAGVDLSIATDSCIPLHPDATWIGLPPGSTIGPQQFLRVVKGAFTKLKDERVELNDIIKLITCNPARVLGVDDSVGTIEVGKRADIVLSRGFPGIDFLDPSGFEQVIKDGTVEITR